LAADVLKGHAPDRLVMSGVHAMTPLKAVVVGPARTLRFLPWRSDATPPPGNLRRDVIDSVRAGEVMVFEAGSVPQNPVFGDMTALRARDRGCAGLVTDGLVRDAPSIADIGFPTFARGTWPTPSPYPLMAWDSDVPIQCGGVLVMPGDWLLADGDGAMVIPSALVSVVAEKGTELLKEEAFCRILLERGHALKECYPLPPRLHPFFQRWRDDGTLPVPEEVRESS
jgi:5-oxopent-3-ene-1,2,5-tricarboxylate decarboxylase / 2-hydroxyhepta-2,4-diene-1,7-dioate isomerase